MINKNLSASWEKLLQELEFNSIINIDTVLFNSALRVFFRTCFF
jgi:hypothetical protein